MSAPEVDLPGARVSPGPVPEWKKRMAVTICKYIVTYPKTLVILIITAPSLLVLPCMMFPSALLAKFLARILPAQSQQTGSRV